MLIFLFAVAVLAGILNGLAGGGLKNTPKFPSHKWRRDERRVYYCGSMPQ